MITPDCQTASALIERLQKLYKGYQNPGMAVPAPSEYELGFNQALDLAIGLITLLPGNHNE